MDASMLKTAVFELVQQFYQAREIGNERLRWSASTNKQNHNVINYDYIVSNHNYICLETSSERKQTHLHSFM